MNKKEECELIKKAILVVSFGSSYEETRNKSIRCIEEAIKTACPDFTVCSAFMSKRILKKMAQENKEEQLGLTQALRRLHEEGIEEVYVQPTFIIEGIQNREMIQEASLFRGQFKKLEFGKPLLTSIKDYKEVIEVFTKEHPVLNEDQAVICMGHGADEYLSVSFAALDYMFKEMDYEQYYVATIRSYPALDHVIKQLKKKTYHKLYIYPFMVVAGYHAHEDMLGKAEAAWKSRLEREGYEVVSNLKGLGEYKGIRQIYIRHVKELVEMP